MTTKQQTNIEFNEVKPKTVNQNILIKSILNNTITICDGPAGSGKTLCSIGIACKLLIQGKIDKILVCRTIVSCGEIGFLPGNESEKIEPYLMGHLEYFQRILGKNYKKYLAEEKIILKPLETLRGTTFDKTVMILDEAQNADAGQIKLFLTRIGQDSKAIVLGDLTQTDTNAAGFRFCTNYLHDIKGCQIVTLTDEDILRNSIIAEIIRIFNKNHL